MALDETPYRRAATEILEELRADVRGALTDPARQLAISAAVIEQIAREVAAAVARRWSGMRVYFPTSVVTCERDWAIYQEWNGRNKRELMRKYELCEVWLDNIIKRCRDIDRARRQVDMFPDGREP